MSTQKPQHPAGHVFTKAGMAIGGLLMFALLLGAAFYAGSFLGKGQLAAVVTSTLVDLTNEDRVEENLPALTVNPTLVAAAKMKAEDMVEKGYFAHTSPEGVEPWHWFSEAGYDFSYAGENLAVNFSDSTNVERAWMDSPDHRANILNGRFTEIGIATAVGTYKGKETTFVVQMFGTPRPVAATPATETPIVRAETPVVPEEPATAIVEEAEDPGQIAVVEPVEETSVLGSEVASIQTTYSKPFDRILVSPQTLLHLIYVICALIILGALILTLKTELKQHHKRHITAAVFLFAVMLVCLIIADRIIFAPPVIG